MTKSTLNPARTHHVHQIRSSLLQDLVDAAPLALQWNNRYVLVRPDGSTRTYEPDTSRTWTLRAESRIDEQMGHMELAMLRSYGKRVDPIRVELPALSHDQVEQAREWWTASTEAILPQAPQGRPQPPMTEDGILPGPLSLEGADRYATDPSLLAQLVALR